VGININSDEEDFKINSIYNILIKKQVKYSTSNNLNNCPETNDKLANKGQNEVKSGKSQRMAAKLALINL
jgi:uncharacterized protein YajQ (UPF0234 family)